MSGLHLNDAASLAGHARQALIHRHSDHGEVR